ncbi:cupin domain-containing protein [Afifella sp. YEN Y35]|uniref:cupin domain-containing protein n=1 Tax=Afifella sp. YEN Y35 TaxID=3388337 RepID=UPI0039DFF5DD
MATHDLDLSVAVESYDFEPSSGIPNSKLPTLVYRGGLDEPVRMAGAADTILKRNMWQGVWVWSIYPFWHFHTKGHEVLACVCGSARVGLGGDDGIETDLNAGDVVVIPAGVGHKRLSATEDFSVVGAYPPGQEGDISKPEEIDFEDARKKAASVPLPDTDPIYGREGPLFQYWKAGAAEMGKDAPAEHEESAEGEEVSEPSEMHEETRATDKSEATGEK